MSRIQKVVIAPDSFKGTMSSREVCGIIERAFHDLMPWVRVIQVPMADGGEGMVDAYLCATGGERVSVEVSDPLGRRITARYGLLGKTAVIEMAAASGLPLVDKRNPLRATSYGTGELIADALGRGVDTIILGLGGSATNDGGVGMASALGMRILDAGGSELEPFAENLSRVRRVDLTGWDPRIQKCRIEIACDVDNPLCGEQGASYVFGPQKGADEHMVRLLECSLAHYAGVLEQASGVALKDRPGVGAAGGLAAPLLAFAGAALCSGVELMLRTVRFDELAAGADLIITGEGRIDGQSIRGKVPVGVARHAGGVPVIAIVGDIGKDIGSVYGTGISAIFSTLRRAVPIEQAKLTCREDLYDATANILRLLRALGENNDRPFA